MDHPINTFKRALARGEHQTGLWMTLASHYATEAVSASNLDWLLLDMEHSPNEYDDILRQLQVIAGYRAHAVVRPVWNDPVAFKRLLDMGAQTLLVPYIQNAEEAKAAVSAMRYPPAGIRGVSAVTRATRFGRLPDYPSRGQDELCLLVQVESVEALAQIEAIADVDGVDGIFIGPGDLAASMGLIGQLKHPLLLAAIEEAIKKIRACGKAPGILTGDRDLAQRFIKGGSLFTAVGVDAALLARAADDLARSFAEISQSGLLPVSRTPT
jgi:4-hydroxy-2-oxoheptanedioate aldolase